MDRHEGLGAKGLGHKRGGRVVHALLEADPRPQTQHHVRPGLVNTLLPGERLDGGVRGGEERPRLVLRALVAPGRFALDAGEPVEIERRGGAVATHVAVRHDAVLAEREGAVLLQVLVEIEHGVEAAQCAEVEEVAPAHILGFGREAVVGALLAREALAQEAGAR